MEVIHLRNTWRTQKFYKDNGIPLTPRIPRSLDKDNNEDSSTKRVCFCKDILHCLKSIPTFGDDEYAVFLSDIDPYYPTIEQVPDVDFTHEIWSLEETIGWYLGRILYKNKELINIDMDEEDFNRYSGL